MGQSTCGPLRRCNFSVCTSSLEDSLTPVQVDAVTVIRILDWTPSYPPALRLRCVVVRS